MKLKRSKTNHRDPGHSFNIVLHGVGRDAFTDWVWIMALSVIAALVLIAYGTFSYIRLDAGLSANLPGGNQPAAIFNQQALSGAIKELDARASERATLRSGYPGPGDPSF